MVDEHQATCPRCGTTEQEVEKAVTRLKQALAPHDVEVSLRKSIIDPATFKQDTLQSNRIMIAGKTLEDWLGARTGQSKCCETCGDSDCRTVEYEEQTHEAIPADLIVRAGLASAEQLFGVKVPQETKRITVLKIVTHRRS